MINLRSKRKRLGIIIGLVIVMAAFYFGFRFWVSEPPPPVSVPPSVQLLGSRLVGRKDGVRQWEILANSVLQANDLVTLREMDEITIFQEDDSHLSIQSTVATWDRKKDVLELQGQVMVEGEDEFRLETELLIWQGGKETLTSPGPVLIHWAGLEIRAGQMVLDVPLSLLTVSEQVEIRDGSLTWKLDHATYDLDAEVVDFYGTLVLEAEVGNDENK